LSEQEGAKKPSWAEGLLDEQAHAASHVGSNARLLAGPGTGKTWTLRARVEFLVLEKRIDADKITALTFTRAAAGELRQRVDRALEGKVATRPHITTLHSFALKTLLHNFDKLDALPRPLRIADDWEERNIVWEDLKAIIDADIPEVRKHFQALSADWDTLRVDEESPNPLHANPGFVGAWQEHRKVYGYTLRSELVYQLKRALEQRSDLEIKPAFSNLLVDEYQDLNKCDLAVVNSVTMRGAELYAAGDDDQSIYGFRYANPEGIRRFDQDYKPSTDLTLATCLRCDKSIMHLAHFVAQLDARRLDKPWEPRDAASEGEVHLLRFHNGESEAAAIASLSRYLIDEADIPPDEILILIRSDRNGAFSKPLAKLMAVAAVPFYVNVSNESVLDQKLGRSRVDSAATASAQQVCPSSLCTYLQSCQRRQQQFCTGISTVL
jgi:DNA helicase-2/ATP-dependent DNA helicase PcrA